jgi:DME family drug/metabolite transporter
MRRFSAMPARNVKVACQNLPMLKGLVLVALAAMSWGTTGSVTTILVSRTGTDAFTMGAIRMWIAAVLLGAAACLIPVGPRLTGSDVARCAAMGLCMALYQVTYFTAVTLVGVALAALIAICSAPLLIVALAALTLHERLTTWMLSALGVGVIGAALLVADPRGPAVTSGAFIAGAALGLGAGLSYAIYVVIAKASLSRSAPLPLAAGTFLAAAIMLTPALWFASDLTREVGLGWPLLLYLGAVTTAAAYALYTLGLRYIPASVAGVVALVEPLTATLLGVFAFRESLGWTGLLGAVLLFVSIALLASAQTSPR